jgi:hypothetical protein
MTNKQEIIVYNTVNLILLVFLTSYYISLRIFIAFAYSIKSNNSRKKKTTYNLNKV